MKRTFFAILLSIVSLSPLIASNLDPRLPEFDVEDLGALRLRFGTQRLENQGIVEFNTTIGTEVRMSSAQRQTAQQKISPNYQNCDDNSNFVQLFSKLSLGPQESIIDAQDREKTLLEKIISRLEEKLNKDIRTPFLTSDERNAISSAATGLQKDLIECKKTLDDLRH